MLINESLNWGDIDTDTELLGLLDIDAELLELPNIEFDAVLLFIFVCETLGDSEI